MTTDEFNRSFAAFSRDRLLPAADNIPARKRRSLFAALLAAAAVFAVLAVAFYFLLRPYNQLMREHGGVSFLPLILAAPTALAVIAFALVFILNLRAMVRDFQTTLIARMAEFIDPGLTHDARSPVEAGMFADSLLFDGLAAPEAGADRFRGRSGGAAVELRGIRLPASAAGEALTGVFMKTLMDKEFRAPLFVFPQSAEVSRGGLERGLTARGAAVAGGLVRIDDKTTRRQAVKPAEAPGWGDGFLPRGVGMTLEELRREDGTELYLGCWGNTLCAALLSRSGKTESPGAFGGFDFDNYRQFCRKGMVAMQLAREVSLNPDIWRE